jgi:hypothetical protein
MNIRRIVNEEINKFLREETESNDNVTSLVPDEMKSWNPIKDFKDGYSNGSDAVDGKMNNNSGNISNNSNQSYTNISGNALGGSSEGSAGGMEGMAGGAEGLAGGIEGAAGGVEMAAVAV